MKMAAVIGMNYGDEGKGHITNYLSDGHTLNVKFNGGAQASHAVFLSDGRSHVFHHFGSGSLRGARTLLASHFIINPIIFVKEMQELCKITNMREVFVDPRCRVTTIYDMYLNGFMAESSSKNDTAGVGINETVERSKFRQLNINARDLFEKSDDKLRNVLQMINDEYIPYRLKELNLSEEKFREYSGIKDPERAIDAFLTLRDFVVKDNKMVLWPDDSLINKFLGVDPDNRKVVFEGGQGMLLDQNRKEYMPYLTRSNTGIQNILECLKTVNIDLHLDVYLVTRSYLTRHGDGPMFNQANRPFSKIEELTNPDNKFQGKMRYGFLSRSWYKRAISETEKLLEGHYGNASKYDVYVAMTCLDHIGKEGFKYCLDSNGETVPGDLAEFPKLKIISTGKTETDVREENDVPSR